MDFVFLFPDRIYGGVGSGNFGEGGGFERDRV